MQPTQKGPKNAQPFFPRLELIPIPHMAAIEHIDMKISPFFNFRTMKRPKRPLSRLLLTQRLIPPDYHTRYILFSTRSVRHWYPF